MTIAELETEIRMSPLVWQNIAAQVCFQLYADNFLEVIEDALDSVFDSPEGGQEESKEESPEAMAGIDGSHQAPEAVDPELDNWEEYVYDISTGEMVYNPRPDATTFPFETASDYRPVSISVNYVSPVNSTWVNPSEEEWEPTTHLRVNIQGDDVTFIDYLGFELLGDLFVIRPAA